MVTPRTSAAIARSLGLTKRQKFNARPCFVEGVRFASQKEARRYCELLILQRAGVIFRLQCQPRYRLCAFTPEPRPINPALGDYVADFRYCTNDHCVCAWGCVIEDVKGFRTPLYRWKKKHVEAQYGIQIVEVT